jgi:hypothetical protein
MNGGWQGKVIKAYHSAYPNPIKAAAGEEVSLRDKETDWPDWYWCRTGDGNEGWVPVSFVERMGDSGRFVRDYDATELTVEEGQRVEVLEAASGWLICRTSDGTVGWLPGEHVARAD